MSRERRRTKFTEWLDCNLRAVDVDPKTVARKARTSVRYLSLLRRGWRTPTVKLARQLGKAMGKPIDDGVLADLAHKPGRKPKSYAPVEPTVETLLGVIESSAQLVEDFLEVASKTSDPWVQAAGGEISARCLCRLRRWLCESSGMDRTPEPIAASWQRAAEAAIRTDHLRADVESDNRSRSDRGARQASAALELAMSPALNDSLKRNLVRALAALDGVPVEKLEKAFESRYEKTGK